MGQLELLLSLALALAIGLLIGLEREQSASEAGDRKHGSFLGGARTYPLVALTGALAALLTPHIGPWLLLVMLSGLFLFLGLSYADDIRAGRDRGLTSEIAFLVAFLLGALAGTPGVLQPLGQRALVLLSAAIVVSLALSLKPPLHAMAKQATKDDVFATLKFLVIAVVILPLLPNKTFGPLDVLNPFKIGLMVVLIAGIDFVGYVLLRVLGPGRGLGVTGLVGGFASSTAVTMSMSNRARDEPKLAGACALAVVTASTVMCPRLLLTVAVVNRQLTSSLGPPLIAMTLAGAAAAWVLYRRSGKVRDTGDGLKLANPFELSSALKWGALFTAVLFLSKLATEQLGSSGSYVAGLVAGTTDVDAIALSMASLAKGAIEPQVAVTTIIIGAASNTVTKGILATVIGGVSYGKRVMGAFGAMIAAGGAVVLALRL
jgi:uncharacterized membrane protein (DUF4010 family)